MSLSRKLKELRQAKDLSVAELADRCGVSEPYLRQIENGRKENPSASILKKLSAALGTTVADLLGSSVILSEQGLDNVPKSLKAFVKKRGRRLGLRQEDIEVLKNVHFRGQSPNREEDWELLFLLLKRICA